MTSNAFSTLKGWIDCAVLVIIGVSMLTGFPFGTAFAGWVFLIYGVIRLVVGILSHNPNYITDEVQKIENQFTGKSPSMPAEVKSSATEPPSQS